MKRAHDMPLNLLRRRKKVSCQRGSILVETAFVLPIIAIIFIIAVDLGLAVREHQLLQNAAREAARFASLPPGDATDAEIQQRVINYCAGEGITVNPADVTINRYYIDPAAVPAVYATEITVSYTTQMLLLGAPFLPSGNVTLTGRSVFRNLY
jgi:Flp pilus assembly protein TadG